MIFVIYYVEHCVIQVFMSTSTSSASVKDKKPKKVTKKKDGPKIHYRELIIEAITALKDRTGSSLIAIENYILKNHKEVNPINLKVQARI